MKVISKLCLLLSCLMLVSSGLWQDWNNNLVLTAASSAGSPPQWIRARNASVSLSMNERYNQYTYILNLTNHQGCTISCGPRSFLGYTSNGLLVCKRDQSTAYWKSSTLALYDQ